jgi:hypothetical protein
MRHAKPLSLHFNVEATGTILHLKEKIKNNEKCDCPNIVKAS